MFMEDMPDEEFQGAAGTKAEDTTNAKDRGGRRRVADRRQFSSSDHFPERRNLRYRRSGNDRRTMLNLKMRKKIERRRMFKEKYLE
jgi:hypothetical protein